MKILFICKHNRFRSKVAETIFNKINKNKNNKAESGGLGFKSSYITKNVVKIMKEKGYAVKGLPRKLKKSDTDNYDLLVIVADNVDKNEFSDFNRRIIKWRIPDCNASEIKTIRKIVSEIEIRVKGLIEDLER